MYPASIPPLHPTPSILVDAGATEDGEAFHGFFVGHFSKQATGPWQRKLESLTCLEDPDVNAHPVGMFYWNIMALHPVHMVVSENRGTPQ